MRRPINWFVFALSLGFLAMGRALQSPPPAAPVIVERSVAEPRVAVAIPSVLRRHSELEFGYVEQDR